MPLSRKKSCARCRHSKLRCNQATPSCSRCSERGIRCVYDWKTASGAPYAYPYPSRSFFTSSRMTEEPPEENIPLAIPAASMQPDNSFELDWTTINSTAIERTFSPPKLGAALDVCPMAAPWNGEEAHGLSEINVEASGAETCAHQNALDPCSLEEVTAALGPQNTACDSVPTSINLSAPRQIFQKRRVLRHSVLGVIALGQLASYPRMMIQGDRLPPFSHRVTCTKNWRLIAPKAGGIDAFPRSWQYAQVWWKCFILAPSTMPGLFGKRYMLRITGCGERLAMNLKVVKDWLTFFSLLNSMKAILYNSRSLLYKP